MKIFCCKISVVCEASNVIVCKEEQPEKALEEITDIELGILTLVILFHPANAFGEIDVTSDVNSIPVKCEHSEMDE